MLDAHLLVGIAHDAAHMVFAFQFPETGAIHDVTGCGIAHDTTHTSGTFQTVFTIKNDVGNNGM